MKVYRQVRYIFNLMKLKIITTSSPPPSSGLERLEPNFPLTRFYFCLFTFSKIGFYFVFMTLKIIC